MTDTYYDFMGLPLTTSSSSAAHSLSEAIRACNNMQASMMNFLKAALVEDPDMPAAHAIRGLVLCNGRNARFKKLIEKSLAAAKTYYSDVSPREQILIDILAETVENRPYAALELYENLLVRWPTDAFAHKMAQLEYYRLGDGVGMRRLADQAASAWSDDRPAYSTFLAIRSFAHEETANFVDAEQYGRDSVARDHSEAWGTHAVAHIMLMRNRPVEGIAWLDDLSPNWEGMNAFIHHLWWHYCLFLLDRGDTEKLLAFYDSHVWNPQALLHQMNPDYYVDLENAASLLMRFELRGIQVGERWQALSNSAESRLECSESPLTSAHAALVFAAIGDQTRYTALIQEMTDFAATDNGPLGATVQDLALPCAFACIAHRRKDWTAVVAALLPKSQTLWGLGGSHAQCDIFYQLLADALRHLGCWAELKQLRTDIMAIGFDLSNPHNFYQQIVQSRG